MALELTCVMPRCGIVSHQAMVEEHRLECAAAARVFATVPATGPPPAGPTDAAQHPNNAVARLFSAAFASAKAALASGRPGDRSRMADLIKGGASPEERQVEGLRGPNPPRYAGGWAAHPVSGALLGPRNAPYGPTTEISPENSAAVDLVPPIP